jgi:hypothetical protein
MRTLEQRVAPAHVEERFLLAGERCVRQVLGSRRRAHRDGDVASAAHALERFEDLAFEPRRERRRQDPLADACADGRERLDVVDVQRCQFLGDAGSKALVLQEVSISLCRSREAVRHFYAGLRKVTDHLAERGVLAADGLDVVAAESGERNCVRGHCDAVGLLLLIQAPVR